MLNKQKLRFDYVYVPAGLDILRSVEIECDVSDVGLDFFITSENAVSESDLMSIITSVQKDTFNRVRIDVVNDCNVLYRHNGVVQKISFNEAGAEIAEMAAV